MNNNGTPTLPSSSSSTSKQQLPVRVLDGSESWISHEDLQHLEFVSGIQNDDDDDDSHRKGHGIRVKILPDDCEIGTMVGEGAANAVFEVCLPNGEHLSHKNTRLLLRLAKKSADGRPSFNYPEQSRFYHSHIKPILGPYVIYQELVLLPSSSTIITSINQSLKTNDINRKAKFQGTLIEPSSWGLLIEDMRPHDSKQTHLIEFKPKWLSQSPSAPPNAIRCRQCAKELHAYLTDPSPRKPFPMTSKPCPLTLVTPIPPCSSSTEAELKRENGPLSNKTTNILRSSPAFTLLKSAQQFNDTIGPFLLPSSSSSPDLDSFSLAMTLRDCTCFAQIAGDNNSNDDDDDTPAALEKIKFGDVDMKPPGARIDYWRAVEKALIDGGFYTASRIVCGGRVYLPPTGCVLEMSGGSQEEGVVEVIRLQGRGFVADDDGAKSVVIGRNGVQLVVKSYLVETDVEMVEKCLEPYNETLGVEDVV